MTRETKIGLTVVTTFLFLFGVVVATKLRHPAGNAEHQVVKNGDSDPDGKKPDLETRPSTGEPSDASPNPPGPNQPAPNPNVAGGNVPLPSPTPTGTLPSPNSLESFPKAGVFEQEMLDRLKRAKEEAPRVQAVQATDPMPLPLPNTPPLSTPKEVKNVEASAPSLLPQSLDPNPASAGIPSPTPTPAPTERAQPIANDPLPIPAPMPVGTVPEKEPLPSPTPTPMPSTNPQLDPTPPAPMLVPTPKVDVPPAPSPTPAAPSGNGDEKRDLLPAPNVPPALPGFPEKGFDPSTGTNPGKQMPTITIAPPTNTGVKPTAGIESRPPLGAPTAELPALVTPPLATAPKSTPVVNMSTDDVYTTRPEDRSFAQLSKQLYGSEKYARALLEYNRRHPFAKEAILQEPPVLEPNQTIYKPPVNVLELRFAQLLNDAPASAPIVTTSPVRIATPVPLTSGAIAAAPKPSNDPAIVYRVPGSGQMIFEIARQNLGDGHRWPEIYRLNPTLQVDRVIPAGTELRVPATAQR